MRVDRAVTRQQPRIQLHDAVYPARGEAPIMVVQKDGVLVTHDQKTMPSHFAAFIATATSPGVLIIPQRLPIATAVEDILLIWSTMDAEEWRNTIRFLPL